MVARRPILRTQVSRESIDMSVPSAFEQLQLELINRFRRDPAGEYDRLVGGDIAANVASAVSFFGVNLAALEAQLSALSAAPALAWNAQLANAAAAHSQVMIDTDSQTHQAPGEPGLGERLRAAGYDFSRAGENVYAFTDDAFQGHAGFIIDWGYDRPQGGSTADDFEADGVTLRSDWRDIGDGIQDPAGHRNSLIDAAFTEIGISAIAESNSATSVGPWVVTQDLGSRRGYEAQFVGVVIDDFDGDGFYDIGEGLGGVTITLTNVVSQDRYTTKSWASGGWQIAVAAGTYDILFAGGDLAAAISVRADIAASNVKVDAVQGQTADNAAPVLDITPLGAIAETSAPGMAVLHLSARDADNDAFSFRLAGSNAARFTIDANNSVVLAKGAHLDFETEPFVELTVVVTDARGASAREVVTFAVADVESPPATDGDDMIEGTNGDDDIDGGAGNDIVAGGLGTDSYHVGLGDDQVRGTLADLNGDTIIQFAEGDSIFVIGHSLVREGILTVAEGQGGIGFDTNGNRRIDPDTEPALFFADSDLGNGDVILSLHGGGTDIRYADFLPSLVDGERAAQDDINGIVNTLYLNGDNASRFRVTLQDSAAGYDNSLGVYEVRGDGSIADVRFLSLDVKADAGEALIVTDVDAGSTLGFFLVQDGANILPQNISATALGIAVVDGTAMLTSGGVAVSGATIFLSHDAALNADGQVHVLSGVDDAGLGALRIGFEDLIRGGAASDDDFQDVVFQVEAQPVAAASAFADAQAVMPGDVLPFARHAHPAAAAGGARLAHLPSSPLSI